MARPRKIITEQKIKEIKRHTRKKYSSEEKIREFVEYYNNERYHESINNVTPADVYYRRDREILKRRRIIKENTLSKRKRINQIAC